MIRLAGGRARSRALNEARKQTHTATAARQTDNNPTASTTTEAAQTSHEPNGSEDAMQVEEPAPSEARQVNTIVVCQ